MKPDKLVTVVAQQKLIIIGLLLILIGNGFQFTFLKVQIDAVVANIGALFLFVGTIEWVFDETARRELVYELFRSIRGDDRLHRNGLIDCVINSREVIEEEEWIKAKTLVIGIHYSPRFVEDNIDLIKERTKNKRRTVICYVGVSTAASEYLKNSASGLSDIDASITKLKSLVQTQFSGSHYVELIEHDRVLRYMFIYTESSIWIKFFTNAKGHAIVPAMRIRAATPLFDFFKNDIRNIGVGGLK
ncbi:hypothetical protein H6G80_28135 [Nostoc sp. FACHB-87]|uniref:hypothetical protein n=1 Tax=Nostocaceae TaxID=1162 RepID=UPI0016891D4B|nr:MULTISPECIES: hypothetical protein [Nostocaceae]MBD2457923.1 hypothetical protein [Nostoc sp. FACHB-87]MBD2479837.1 hypothetical protein [Anabaena sp. FACHB-83]